MAKTLISTRKESGIVISPPRSKEQFYWNPSIIHHKGEIYVSFRSWLAQESTWRPYTSPLIVGKLKDDKLVEYKTLQPQNAPESVIERGLEDVRIWSDGNEIYGIGAVLDKVGERLSIQQAEIQIDYESGTYKVLKQFGNPRRQPEKNWSPIEGKPFEYMYSILEYWYGGRIHPTRIRGIMNRHVHNGTPLLKYKDGWIGVSHQRIRLLDRVCYTNIFVHYDHTLTPVELSDWFIFADQAHQEVQFISGAIMLDNETIGLTVGLDRISVHVEADYKGLLYKVKLEDIQWRKFHPLSLVIQNGVVQ